MSAERFLNRELSWLEFDRRVLALAEEADRPLLERVRFLAIFARNLDEFFMVRVSGLQDAVALGSDYRAPDGRSAAEQLAEIRQRVVALSDHAQEIWSAGLRPALAEAGIELASHERLTPAEREGASRDFRARIQPLLVPLSVDPSHPFPYISNLSLSVGALVRPRKGGAERFARVKVPPRLERWWPAGPGRLVAVEELVEAHLGLLFPDDEIVQSGHFRVTRDADLELASRERSDWVANVEAGLRRRRRGSDAVRLEADAELGPRIRSLLVRELGLEDDEVYDVTGLLDLAGLDALHRLDRPDLKEDPCTPQPAPGLSEVQQDPQRFFAAIRRSPRLVHHPYESFERSVEAFLRAAAEDPQVQVIMATLYRTGGPESGIVRALEAAAAQGKQVAVLVELTARFDEASNLERARGLERAGAYVVYGVDGLKTHAKLALVVREEGGVLRRYCHVGTGNYNPDTARQYEDLGLLTDDEDITLDVSELLHRMTSSSAGRHYRRLLVAPEGLRAGLLQRIAREAEAPDGRIVIKTNALSDPELIDALYAASQRGARVDLVVRGICCLRPGIPGLSEGIRVRSVLGRFLEHSRIYRFGSEARGLEHWIGSADCMPRNLDLRVEALAPVEDPGHRQRLDSILELLLCPEAKTWELAPDGSWKRAGGDLDVQRELLRRAEEAAAASA